MKLLIAFSCAIALASAQWSGHNAYHVPVIGPNGVPVETPEVQAARNYHLSALNEAASRAGPSTWNQGNTWDQGNSWNDGSQRGPDSRYYGPHAYQTTHGVAKVTADGVPLDNPEVAAAKANHFAAFSEALSRNVPTHGYGHYRKRRGIYGGYPAHVDYNFYGVGHDGRPLDTPAVAHAKAAHYAAFNEAAARNGVGHAGLIAAPWGYGGVAAIHNGVPVDTPEVQQAKAAHFAAHAAAAHRH